MALEYKTMLKTVIANTDLDIYLEEDDKLDYAIAWATQEIKNRLALGDEETIPARYDFNIIEGAKWYLATEGAEGESSHNENGVNRVYKDMPDWLARIPSKVTVVKRSAKKKSEDSLFD